MKRNKKPYRNINIYKEEKIVTNVGILFSFTLLILFTGVGFIYDYREEKKGNHENGGLRCTLCLELWYVFIYSSQFFYSIFILFIGNF